METQVKPFILTHTLRASDVDVRNKLKLSSLFLLMQDAAAHHAQMYGFGFEGLDSLHAFWVLSRAKVALSQLPECNSQLVITTWPCGTDKLFALRDFRFSNTQGNLIGAATTSWLILDKSSMRPQRPTMLNNLIYPRMARPFATDAGKIKEILEMEHSHACTARYNDIDMNNHVNNATYIDWMLNSLSLEELPTTPLAFDINFNGQVLWGENVQVSRTYQSPIKLGFAVQKGQEPVTSASLRYTDDDTCLFS